MLQRLSELDLIRLEFADFCHARGSAEYDYTSYHLCAVQQFVAARCERTPLPGLPALFDCARQRPWNFGALAYRLALAEGK